MSAIQINAHCPILIDIPMPIVTPRLLLRPVMPGDGAALNEAQGETWEQLHRWMPWANAPEPPTVDESEEVVRRACARFILREDMMMVGIERETDRHAIYTGLHRFDWRLRNFKIGYWVRQSAQGNGYATESANALTRYAFGALDARRVEISHAEGNDASRAVIQRLGFNHEATMPSRHLLPDGRVVADLRYARLTTDGLPDLDVSWDT